MENSGTLGLESLEPWLFRDLFNHCGLENDLRLERYDTQNEWGAWNYDQKCMEKGENQNLTTPPFPEKNWFI